MAENGKITKQQMNTFIKQVDISNLTFFKGKLTSVTDAGGNVGIKMKGCVYIQKKNGILPYKFETQTHQNFYSNTCDALLHDCITILNNNFVEMVVEAIIENYGCSLCVGADSLAVDEEYQYLCSQFMQSYVINNNNENIDKRQVKAVKNLSVNFTRSMEGIHTISAYLKYSKDSSFGTMSRTIDVDKNSNGDYYIQHFICIVADALNKLIYNIVKFPPRSHEYLSFNLPVIQLIGLEHYNFELSEDCKTLSLSFKSYSDDADDLTSMETITENIECLNITRFHVMEEAYKLASKAVLINLSSTFSTPV